MIQVKLEEKPTNWVGFFRVFYPRIITPYFYCNTQWSFFGCQTIDRAWIFRLCYPFFSPRGTKPNLFISSFKIKEDKSFDISKFWLIEVSGVLPEHRKKELVKIVQGKHLIQLWKVLCPFSMEKTSPRFKSLLVLCQAHILVTVKIIILKNLSVMETYTCRYFLWMNQ